MNKEEYERKVTELKSMKIALFTDEIRNSNLYYKINMDSDLPAKLENLKIECKKFENLSHSVECNLTLTEMKNRIKLLNEAYCRIETLLSEIDWN